MRSFQDFDRREILRFLGTGALVASNPWWIGCRSSSKKTIPNLISSRNGRVPAIAPSTEDLFKLAQGWQSKVLISEGAKLGNNLYFGTGNDFTQTLPREDGDGIWLWVNHEYFGEVTLHGHRPKRPKSKEIVDFERMQVGGSLLHLQQVGDTWVLAPGEEHRRYDAATPIPLDRPIMGAEVAIGTLANCSGGVTPWGTFLSCEENYDNFYGDFDYKADRSVDPTRGGYHYGWTHIYPHPPEHYGWIVEIDPKNGKAVKRTALGRFEREGACVTVGSDGRTVVYSGEDRKGGYIFKFVSDKANSLESGKLFVADVTKGRWIPMWRAANPKLAGAFDTDLDVLTYLRISGGIAGGTPQNRPEGVVQDPLTGAIAIARSNNSMVGDHHGSVLRIEETGGPAEISMSFSPTVLVHGGAKHGLTCPDNLMFDAHGNLFVFTDVLGKYIEQGPYRGYGNNAGFVIPREGPDAGRPIRIFQAPRDAELTGPSLSPDGETLFLAVQHPGEMSQSKNAWTSHWPNGGRPLASVVQIRRV